MNKSFVFLFLYCLLFLGACTETEDDLGNEVTISEFVTDGIRKTPEEMPGTSVENVSSAHGYYSFTQLLKPVSGQDNFVIAPSDWQLFLSYLAVGASDSSLDALSDAAQIDLELSLEDFSVWDQALLSLSSVDRQRSLQVQTNYLFKQDFLTTHIEIFGTVLSETDFAALLGNTDATRLVLSQSSKITSGWSTNLSAEEVQMRFGHSSGQQWVPGTKLSGIVKKYRGEWFDVVQLPLTNDELSMVILIPDEGFFNPVAKSFDYDTWNTVIAGLQEATSTVYLPDFSMLEYMEPDDLPLLGVATSDTLADFSAINGQGYLFIDDFSQVIELRVSILGINSNIENTAKFNATEDEPSTVFAGITVTTGSVAGFSSFNVYTPGHINYKDCFYSPDQSPFIFAIYHQASKTILHLGQIKSLKGQSIAADWQVPDYSECGIEPPVEIYKHRGSVQCDFNSGTDLDTMSLELTNAGVEVLESREDYDGYLYPAVCGAADGKINVFNIRQSQLEIATGLGFNLLSDLSQ